MTDRIAILHEINILSDTHCSGCTILPPTGMERQLALSEFCKRTCPVGAEFRRLGEELIQEVRERRRAAGKPIEGSGAQNLAPAPKPQPRSEKHGRVRGKTKIRKAEIAKLLGDGKTVAEIEQEKGLKSGTLGRWVKMWKLREVERR